MPVDVSQLTAYPASQPDSETEKFRSARIEKWARVKALLVDGDVERAKSLMNELEAEASARYRVLYGMETK